MKPPTRALGWSKDSKFVLISDDWDIWKIGADGGPAINLTATVSATKSATRRSGSSIRTTKGIDLSKPLYVRTYGQLSKKNGITVIDAGATSAHSLVLDEATYANVLKAKKADTFLYSRETTTEFPDYYVAQGEPISGKRVTDGAPQQKNFEWTKGTRMVEYVGPKGDKLQGVLYLPANYESGKKYPTIVYIYEKLTQNKNAYPAPVLSGTASISRSTQAMAMLF